jgi:DNA mismatch endonuclease, patch repair protein
MTRTENMRRIRSVNTNPEITVRRFLHNNGFRFRIHRKDLPGSPDIVLPKYKTVIFVNGCFWHRHEGCKRCTTPSTNQEYWIRKFENNKERDKGNYTKLNALGWRVIVAWECETKKEEFLHSLVNRLKEIGTR